MIENKKCLVRYFKRQWFLKSMNFSAFNLSSAAFENQFGIDMNSSQSWFRNFISIHCDFAIRIFLAFELLNEKSPSK